MASFLSLKPLIKTSSSSVPPKNFANACRKMGLRGVGMRPLTQAVILSSTKGPVGVYAVSYGRKSTGNIHEGNATNDAVGYYFSIEYLGIEPSRITTWHFELPSQAQPTFFQWLFNKQPVPPFFSELMKAEVQIIAEMKTLARYCKESWRSRRFLDLIYEPFQRCILMILICLRFSESWSYLKHENQKRG